MFAMLTTTDGYLSFVLQGLIQAKHSASEISKNYKCLFTRVRYILLTKKNFNQSSYKNIS